MDRIAKAWKSGLELCDPCFRAVQPLLTFTASKYVVIKDWRLGLTLRALQLVILIYVAQDIFKRSSYQEVEIPQGVVVPYGPAGANASRFREIQRQMEVVDEGLPYCQEDSTDYSFQWSGLEFKNFRCVLSDMSSLTSTTENQFFVSTYFTLDKILYVIADSKEECPEPGKAEDLPDEARHIGFVSNTCVYVVEGFYFPVLPEDVPLNLVHGFFTSKGESDTLPRTIIQGLNTVKDIKRDENIQMTTKEWLDLAGIDLDKTLDELPMGKNEKSIMQAATGDRGTPFQDKYPRARLSGLSLLVTMEYMQRKYAPEPYRLSTGEASRDVICMINIAPQYRWTLKGSDLRYMITNSYDPLFLERSGLRGNFTKGKVVGSRVDFKRHGIAFSFKSSGKIGYFSLNALINAIVAGSVLLGLAQIVVVVMALYFLGLSSVLYREYMRESVDWRKEYARYAAQALVAGFAFMGYDTNHSGRLDRREIFQVLNTILGHRLSRDKLAALTDFLMRQGEQDSDVQKGRFTMDQLKVSNNTISIEEWIDIFTEEKLNLASLTRLIESEYSHSGARAFLERLAVGGSTIRTRSMPPELVALLERENAGEDDIPEEEEESSDDEQYELYTQQKQEFFIEFFKANMPANAEEAPVPDLHVGNGEGREEREERDDNGVHPPDGSMRSDDSVQNIH